MKRNIRARFHLGKGEKFMKWRVENIDTKEVLVLYTSGHNLFKNALEVAL